MANVTERPAVRAHTPLEKIPVFVPSIGVDTLKHLTDALDVGWLGMGATIKEFEERIAELSRRSTAYVVCTNTGTAAASHRAASPPASGPATK